jgi:hypothetical protein
LDWRVAVVFKTFADGESQWCVHGTESWLVDAEQMV